MSHDIFEEVFADWWRDLTNAEDGGKKADKAALRRLGAAEAVFPPEIDVVGAIAIPAFRDLHRRTRKWHDLREDRVSKLVVAAAVLAHVREVKPDQTAAARLGASRKEGDENPLMAEPRFRRLLRTTDPVELCDQARRAVALLGRGAAVGELGASLFKWNDKTRRTWAAAYWRLDDTIPASGPASGPTPANGAA